MQMTQAIKDFQVMKKIALLVAVFCLVLCSLSQESPVQPTQLDQAFQYVYAQWARAKLDDAENTQGKAAFNYLYQAAKSWEMYETKLKESTDAKVTESVPAVPAVESPESGGGK